MKQIASAKPLSKEALAGPIISNRTGEMTTIWRDGEVIRENITGRVWRMADTIPVRRETGENQ
jgi:hypothetical protein